MSWRRPTRPWRRSRNARGSACRWSPRLPTASAKPAPRAIAREARISALLKTSGTRLVGPSSLGVVDLRHKTLLTANAAFDEPGLPVGRIFAASHSGGMIGTLLSRGKARGIGFAGLVSVGNEVDLSIGEVCAATLDDPGIDGYLLFLETLRKARDAARLCVAGRPARQAGAGLQARPVGGGARAFGLAHRRARGRGRHCRRVPGRMRHRAGRHAGGTDRGLSFARSRAGAGPRRTRSHGRASSPPPRGGATMVVDPLRGAASRSSRRVPRPWRS